MCLWTEKQKFKTRETNRETGIDFAKNTHKCFMLHHTKTTQGNTWNKFFSKIKSSKSQVVIMMMMFFKWIFQQRKNILASFLNFKLKKFKKQNQQINSWPKSNQIKCDMDRFWFAMLIPWWLKHFFLVEIDSFTFDHSIVIKYNVYCWNEWKANRCSQVMLFFC